MPTSYTFDISSAANLLSLLSHDGRRRVLLLVLEREWDVTSLASEIGLSQSALSQHLTKLKAGGLVKVRRKGQTIYYSCSSDKAATLTAVLQELYPVQELRAAA